MPPFDFFDVFKYVIKEIVFYNGKEIIIGFDFNDCSFVTDQYGYMRKFNSDSKFHAIMYYKNILLKKIGL